jgi:hypothetical protein
MVLPGRHPPGTVRARSTFTETGLTMSRLLSVVLLVGPLLISSCGDPTDPDQEPVAIALLDGDEQDGSVGTALADPLRVVVTDGEGEPVAGVGVTWAVLTGGGSITPTSSTDASGVAAATFTLGPANGAHTASASVPGLTGSPVAFSAVSDGIVPPLSIELLDGDGQVGSIGTALADPLRVRVTDAEGTPVPGVLVTWAVITGGGSITPSSNTDGAGIAEATFTLGPAIGEHRASASAGITGSPVEFTATAGGITVAAAIPVRVHDMFVRDGLVFVFAWNLGVRIYDVGNGMNGGSPTSPQLVGTLITSASGLPCICAHNGWWFHSPSSGTRYLFVGQEGPFSIGSSSSGDIHVVDVSNPAAPVEVASYRHPNQPDVNGTPRPAGVHNLWMDEANEILYAAFYNGGVVALDVSGTLSGDLSGRLIGSIRPGGAGGTYTWGVQVANGSLYAIDMKSGLYQLQLQGGELQVLSGGGNVPGQYSSDLWVTPTHAYTGTWSSNGDLHVWTLDGTGAPTRTATVSVPDVSTISDVEVSPDGGWLALTTENGANAGLHLYSLADRGNPDFLARYLVHPTNFGLHTGTIAQIGGRWYVFAARNVSFGIEPEALLILDVTDVLP